MAFKLAEAWVAGAERRERRFATIAKVFSRATTVRATGAKASGVVEFVTILSAA